jgi:ankyrin repeat protein
VDRMMEPVTVKGEAAKRPRIPAAAAQQCLWGAAGSGNVALLQYWLDQGADPASRSLKNDADWMSGWGILAHGVMSGNPEMVRKLLSYKVDVNERIQDSPLLIFVFQRSRGKPEQTAEIVGMLAKAGADVNARDFMGQTPIFAAEYTPEAIKPLLAAGADLEARDNSGNTPLIRYAFMEPMVRELLADGADPTAVAKNGDTALKVAKRYPGWPACITMIEEALKKRAPGGTAVSNSQ